MLDTTELSAPEVVKRGLSIAGDICVFTNHHHTIETLG
jgi:ATP-dependent HslUV protease subunit HslV